MRLIFFTLIYFFAPTLAIFCFQPFVPENGHVIFNEPGPYEPGTVAKYSCALGFERLGAEERTCRSDGSWSLTSPTCAIDVAANKPMSQSSGAVAVSLTKGLCTQTDNEKNSYWEVDLLGDYTISSISVRLGSDSSPIQSIELIQASGQVKTCSLKSYTFTANSSTLVNCGDHEHIARVRIQAHQRLHLCHAHVFAIDAVSSWQCAQGSMDVVGVFNGICFTASKEEQTDWLGAQRKCLDRGASLPLRIEESTRRGLRAALSASHSTRSFYWIGVSSSVTKWRWVDGDPVGETSDWPNINHPIPSANEAVLMARPLDWRWVPASQNAWNSFLCQSKPKFCTSPGVGEATKVIFSSHSYAIGTLCFYSCEEGYEMEGEKQRECQENGRWSGSIPNCYKRSCGPLPVWRYGKIRLLNETTVYQSEAEYECFSGYQLRGATRRSCLSDGTWSGEVPSCEEVDCGRAMQVANGRVVYNSTTFESQANYTCQDGFRLIGPESVFCNERGNWEPSPPFCYDIGTLHEMKGLNSASPREGASGTDGNIALAVLAVLLVCCLVIVVLKMSRTSSRFSDIQDKLTTSSGIYATPQMQQRRPDSVVYYASCAPIHPPLQQMEVTQMEVPPHLLKLQQLPNGNIHVTLPVGRPMVRPSIPVFSPSPTPSQLMYSFDHEPIYDTPPDGEENIYEKMPTVVRPAPKPPVRNPASLDTNTSDV